MIFLIEIFHISLGEQDNCIECGYHGKGRYKNLSSTGETKQRYSSHLRKAINVVRFVSLWKSINFDQIRNADAKWVVKML